MDSEFTGKHYTLDFDLNPSGMWGIHITGDVDGPVDAKWTMQKDYTMGEIVVKYKNQNYAFMQLKGNAEMRGVFPVVFDYVVKYNIKDAMEHQGKAKMKFDGKTPAKKFEMSFAPKTGTPMDLIWNMDFSSGFKYDYDFKMNAVTMEKGNGEYKWVNNGQKFELMTKDTFIVTKQSPFHWMNTMVTGGREWTKMELLPHVRLRRQRQARLLVRQGGRLGAALRALLPLHELRAARAHHRRHPRQLCKRRLRQQGRHRREHRGVPRGLAPLRPEGHLRRALAQPARHPAAA